MRAKAHSGRVGSAMWARIRKLAHCVSPAFLLLFCGLCLMVERGSAQLSNSDIEALFAHSLENGVLTTDDPEFKIALSYRVDSGTRSHREYLVFNGYGFPGERSGSLRDICVIQEDWHFKSPERVVISQFIICQPPYSAVDSFRSHKFITESNSGTVLNMVWTKFSGKEAHAVQRSVADRFLADAYATPIHPPADPPLSSD